MLYEVITALAGLAAKAAESTTLRVTIISADGNVLADSHNEPADMNNHADRPEIQGAMSSGYGASIRIV